MAWHCVHCGTEVHGEANRCPNCEQDPYRTEPDELLDVSPKDFRKFLVNGKLEPRKRKTAQKQ